MDFDALKQEHGTPEKLERYAFLWSLARMVIAAVSLLIGGVPAIVILFGHSHMMYGGALWSLLNFAWIISGIAAVYLVYRWNQAGRTVFGGTDQKDTIAFLVMAVSGINLGFAGLGTKNIGMSIFHGDLFYLVGGIIYLVTTWYLFTRWKACGETLFGAAATDDEKAGAQEENRERSRRS